jgi:hypothetical protein
LEKWKRKKKKRKKEVGIGWCIAWRCCYMNVIEVRYSRRVWGYNKYGNVCQVKDNR